MLHVASHLEGSKVVVVIVVDETLDTDVVDVVCVTVDVDDVTDEIVAVVAVVVVLIVDVSVVSVLVVDVAFGRQALNPGAHTGLHRSGKAFVESPLSSTAIRTRPPPP
jgi:hypothetical protein